MNTRISFLLLFFILAVTADAQELVELPGKPGVSLRGLSVVNERMLWVSGSKGTVGRSTDGGKHFTWMTVKGHEQRDFRDIEAFDAVTAVVIAVDSPGLILRTYDGGATWNQVYRNNRSGIFLDAMTFWKDEKGMVIGDPLDGRFFLLQTDDSGRSWRELPEQERPLADTGEACFAASGSNIRLLSGSRFAFVSGGRKSRAFVDGKVVNLPLVQGEATTGANGLAVRKAGRKKNSRKWVVVGGDFAKDTSRASNIAITTDGGRTWKAADVPPFGYRSGVVFLNGRKLVACGTSGVDVSSDGGRTWRNISKTGYHVTQRSKSGRAVYLAGGNGRVARLKW
ncbi:WD40/YVTN/BNR-like repeat-containing protein [Flavihumibacter solisilvae]|uniref:Oxidoreductase n=1 Tax=Flavihumibacter solisilvae TaxID=1349421 RepID=A0A0C1IL55_9BACT|nr:hypothetical protein [Flavihumibacter solisilvae]KIC94885.1 hypothetical protein OI18_08205 [Flavihumibacter solisilvae]